MEVYGIILLLAMIGLASKSQIMSPMTQYDLTGEGDPSMECRPATDEELARAGQLANGKPATFHLQGFYRCERDVFEYGERNSFINFVTKEASAHADFTARRVKSILMSSPGSLTVDIVTDDGASALKPYLYQTYEQALVNRLGPDRVLRRKPAVAVVPFNLRIQVQRLDDASSLFHAQLYRLKSGQGQGEWIDI